MKVLHAAETTQGGVRTILVQHLEKQTETFGRANVMALVPEQDRQPLNSAITDEQIATFMRSGRNVGSMLRFFYAFTVLVLRYRPQVVHLHSSFAGVLGRGSLFFLKPFIRPKIIYCPHGFSFMMSGHAALAGRLYGLLERVLAHITDAVICVSHYERAIAKENRIPAQKLVVIPNGIEILRSSELIDGRPRQRAVSPIGDNNEGVVNLLFVGRLDTSKGIDVLIRAFDQLPDTKYALTVVGSAVVDEPVRWDTHTRAEFVGWQSGAALLSYYAQADVLVVPSRWEAFGLVVVEAAAHGCPALASNVGGLPELIEDGRTGRLFKTECVPDLLRVLTTVTKDEWRRMGQYARSATPVRFSSERMTAETMDLYR